MYATAACTSSSSSVVGMPSPSSSTSGIDRRKVLMKSASYGDAVVESLSGLQKGDDLCDFTIAAQGKSFRVSCFSFIFELTSLLLIMLVHIPVNQHNVN